MSVRYLLKPAVLASTPGINISKQQYVDAKRCGKQVYEAFEIELAFEFLVTNYVEIEKYIAEHLVLDMAGQSRTVDSFRLQQWGFARTFNNLLASISFWRDLTRNRLIAICGRGAELKEFDASIGKLQNDVFATAFLFHMRNYSQHGGFPVTGSSTGSRWNEQWTEITYSASYTLSYDLVRPYFEQTGKGSRARKSFRKEIEAYSKGEPIDLKPVIRRSLGFFGQFMDEVRASMRKRVQVNEDLVTELIELYRSTHPGISILGLSVMPVDQDEVVENEADIVPVRDEFIERAKEMRLKNNGKSLANLDKRIISNR